MPARCFVWRREDVDGMEIAVIRMGDDRLSASGAAIGADPMPYRLDYHLDTSERFITRRFVAMAAGVDWHRRIELSHDGVGTWSCRSESEGGADLPEAGGDPEAVAGGLDVDLGFSPLTNTPPILRHALGRGGDPVDVDTAWVSVPDLSLHRSEQRYVPVRSGDRPVVRYETRTGAFTADLELDTDGFVVRYPKLGWRVAAS